MSQSNKPDELEQRELLAFELFAYFHPDARSHSREDMAQAWRSSEEIRKDWREFAAQFAVRLQDVGLDVRLYRTTLLRNALKDLITIPAQAAYEVGKD